MRAYKPGKRLSSALSVAEKFRPGPRLSMPSSDMGFDQTGHWPVMRTKMAIVMPQIKQRPINATSICA